MSIAVAPIHSRKSVAAGVSSLGNYAKSPDAQDVAASTVDVVAAISGAASAIRDAFREAKKEFDEKSTPSWVPVCRCSFIYICISCLFYLFLFIYVLFFMRGSVRSVSSM